MRSKPLPPDAPDADWAAPPSLKESLTVGLVRWGCFELYRLPFRMHNHGVNPKEKLVVSRLRYGEGKAGERPIAFRLEEGSGKAEVRLWFDPKTYALRKREVTLPGGESQFEGTLTETYEAFVVGGEIPDETFKFPDK